MDNLNSAVGNKLDVESQRDKKKKSICVRLELDLFHRLSADADQQDRSRGAQVRTILRGYYATRPEDRMQLSPDSRI